MAVFLDFTFAQISCECGVQYSSFVVEVMLQQADARASVGLRSYSKLNPSDSGMCGGEACRGAVSRSPL